jgi:hypothetical protein
VAPNGLSVTGRVSLVDKVLGVHTALDAFPHAFGGALALAYWAEPRATSDIDVNVFVPVEQGPAVLAALAPLGIDPDDAAQLIACDGQARVDYAGTPLDLFFAYDPFHHAAAAGTTEVPFSSQRIRVLSATHLAVCKVVFDRPKDWVDIDAMLALGTHIDAAEVLRWVGRLIGDSDPRYDRIGALLANR